VKIWQDPWIPRPWCRRLVTHRGDSILTKVSELINPVTGQWNHQLVLDTFSSEEARLILNLPLRDGAVDFLAWHFDPRGLHIVYAYKLFSEGLLRAAGADHSSSAQKLEC
jgi:hypothetical protein